MAREATITQDDVATAAETLRAQGVRPTARAVRQLLGVGSMATVLRYLQAWQATQHPEPAKSVVFPPGLQKVLSAFIAQEVAAARLETEQELAILKQTLTDLVAENERQATTLEERQEYIEALHIEKAELTGRMDQLARDLASAHKEGVEAREAAESARTQLARTEQQLDSLRPVQAELVTTRTSLEGERNARFEAQKEAAVSAAKLEQAEARLTDLQARLTRNEAELAQLRQARPTP